MKKEIVVNEWGLPHPYSLNKEHDIEILGDSIIDQRRWVTVHRLLLRIKDKFYETTYQHGSTECQDESPWEHVSEVNFIELRKVQKLVDVWEPVS